MSNVETTELKLKTTPTGGVDASHSPYYRRLLSAGYKGFLQGTIGGASLYGVVGAVIGGALAIVAAPVLTAGSAIALIGAAAGVGVLKGASTFGNIGSVAAINAESADLSEQRRYLLDRYYDLPEGPEGDREAEAIKQELIKANDTAKEPPHFFHWKTVAICAMAGAAIAGLLLLPGAAPLLASAGIVHGIDVALVIGSLPHAAFAGFGALAGALSGAVIGIDRYYIRKWFDHTEGVVHSSSHKEGALRERSALVSRLQDAAKEDAKTKETISTRDNAAVAETPQPPAPAPVDNQPAPPQLSAVEAATPVAPEKPSTKISEATLHRRLADLQQALEVPAL